jgi:anti-anti-sigma factor
MPPTNPLAAVSREEQGGVIVATVRGEVDVSNVTQIGRELMEIPNQALGLVVDLEHIDYLDSAGIALLYELHLRLERRGQALAVVAPRRGTPRRVLELTAFSARAVLVDEVDAAVATVQGAVGGSSPSR